MLAGIFAAGNKKLRPPLTFGRVLSRLGKVQTSLPLLSLLQNLRESKKSRKLTRARASSIARTLENNSE